MKRTHPHSAWKVSNDAALHLTCAAEEGCTAIHTSDRHMAAAAPAFGLHAVTL